MLAGGALQSRKGNLAAVGVRERPFSEGHSWPSIPSPARVCLLPAAPPTASCSSSACWAGLALGLRLSLTRAGVWCPLLPPQMSMPMVSSRGDGESVRRCLAHSLFMSTAELQPDGTYVTTDSRQPVAIHPSSVLFHCRPACVVYTELLHTSRCYMRDVCVVDAEWLHEAAPDYFRRKLRAARN